MKKSEKGFICTKCGYKDKYYHVVCPSCGAEDSMVDLATYQREQGKGSGTATSLFSLWEIEEESFQRVKTPWPELDEVLGGGIVTGSITLLAGPPGVGKSTLALTLLSSFRSPLYISGEENLSQVASRARRIGVNSDVKFSFSTLLNEIKVLIDSAKPDFVVIDSLQVMRAEKSAAFFSTNEARLFMSELVSFLKPRGISALVLGHITKEGSVAGPKTVEHLVDVVAYLNRTERAHIRSFHVGKNRFGPSDGIVFMEMTDKGITPYKDDIVLTGDGYVGQAYTVALQGNTPKIVSVQALITPSYTQQPRRVVSGYPMDKFVLLLAILEKRLGLKLYNKDIFVKITGDYYWRDSAMDLAIVSAILSAYYNIPLPSNAIWIGELDLLGNILSAGDETPRKRMVSSAGGYIIELGSLEELRKIIQRWR